MWSYRFKVSVSITTLVDVSNCSQDLSEEEPRLILVQVIPHDDVIKQLSVRAVLEQLQICLILYHNK